MSWWQYIHVTGQQQLSFRIIAARRFAVVALLASGVVWGCAGPGQEQIELAPRAFTYGVALPYPIHIPTVEPDTAALGRQIVSSIPIEITVGADGRPDSIHASYPEDADLVRAHSDFLRQLRFEPGLRDSIRIAVRIAVVMRVGAPGASPALVFPVERNRTVRHMDLYYQAFEWLGYDLPSIAYFPSYQFPPILLDTFKVYPFELIRVELDSAGRPTAISSRLSSLPELSAQLRSAANWARYEPLRYRGQAQPTTAYLLVSLLAGVKCPTKPLATEDSPSSMREKLRVRLLPDTVGLMSMPLPRRNWTEEFSSGARDSLGDVPMSVDFTIGPSGQVAAYDVNPRRGEPSFSKRQVWFAKWAVTRIAAFHPALGFDGLPRSFDGFAFIEPASVDSIRIRVDWLSGRRLRPND
jgi:hypothetical protein